MNAEFEDLGQVVMCRPGNQRMDVAVAGAFRSQLLEWTGKGRRKFVVNFNEVRFIDSAGLSSLVAAYQKINGEGAIRLCCVNAGVRRVFELTRLSRIFAIFETEEQALEAF